MPKAKRSRTGPSIRRDLIGSMYELLGIDPDAKLPHPEGLPVKVLPSAGDGVKTGGRLRKSCRRRVNVKFEIRDLKSERLNLTALCLVGSGALRRPRRVPAAQRADGESHALDNSFRPLLRGRGHLQRDFPTFIEQLASLHYRVSPPRFSLSTAARAQPNAPHIGYVYPAGGRQGATFQVVVGGQFLSSVTNVCFSGDGIRATVLEYNRPLTQKEFNDLRDKFRELQEKRRNAQPAAGNAARGQAPPRRRTRGPPRTKR